MNEQSDEIKAIVEKIGVLFEKNGFSPVGGRIIGLLLVSEPPHRTFDEFVEFLGASKSSVSNSINFLMEQGVIDYFTQPGDRKRYFTFVKDGWFIMIEKKLGFMIAMGEILKDVIKFRCGDNEEFERELNHIIEMHKDFINEMREILSKYRVKFS